MRTLIEAPNAGPRPAILIALLPGTFSQPEDFVREGFPAALRAQGIEADVVMAEVRAAWFADGSIVRRIEGAVVGPARGRGHSRIWLAGISLGGLAARGYCARHGGEIEGVVLISPYPATREVLREIEAAGGIGHWQPVIAAGGDLEREAWQWLATRREEHPNVHCYIASADRFAPGQRLMARTLDPRKVRERPGGHDWKSWRALWAEFLADAKAVLQ